MSTSIPVLDLAATDVAAQFGRAYSEVGFAYLEDRGVAPSLIEEAFAQSRRFHALPLDEKLRLKVNDQRRGYMPFAESKIVSSSIQKATKPNLSESLMVMHEVDDSNPDHADDPLAHSAFFDPGASAVVRPLDCCIPAGEQPRYDALIYGEYLVSKLDANHSYRQSPSR